MRLYDPQAFSKTNIKILLKSQLQKTQYDNIGAHPTLFNSQIDKFSLHNWPVLVLACHTSRQLETYDAQNMTIIQSNKRKHHDVFENTVINSREGEIRNIYEYP